jgi:hypothetical protein
VQKKSRFFETGFEDYFFLLSGLVVSGGSFLIKMDAIETTAAPPIIPASQSLSRYNA